MSDPAKEAAVRAISDVLAFAPKPQLLDALQAAAIAGASEALKPIRELELPNALDRLADILAHLVMDTKKDQELTDRYVTMLRDAAKNVRPLLYSSDELGRRAAV